MLALVGSFAGYTWWKMLPKTPQQNLTVVRPPGAPAPPAVQEVIIPPTEVISPNLTTRLQAKEETWVEVRNAKGEILLQRLFYPGESYTFENSQQLVLKTGNAQGIVLQSGEKTLSFPGEEGEIKSGISLDPQMWSKNAPGSEPE